jgi:uncharacterized membrane protein YdbT with pleckstrin-like domain
MGDFIRRQILHWMRVPPKPDPPEGSAESIRVFRAGQNFYRWRLALWVVANIGAAIGIVVAFFFWRGLIAMTPPLARLGLHAAELVGAIGFIVSLPFTFYRQRLDYEMRWYVVTDRSLRIRSGIWNVAELTMTFANIQDLRVTAGPIQGLFKLADVEVRSAGGGGASGPYAHDSHVAYFEGVDNAEAIRDLVVERLRRYRDAGLGDFDAHHPVTASETPGVLDAAAAVLQEARALRAALALK